MMSCLIGSCAYAPQAKRHDANAAASERRMFPTVCTENLSSGVVVMKSAQDGA